MPSNTTSTSTKTVVSLVLGILSLTCCGFLTGIPAILIGRAEANAAKAGTINPSNQSMATIAFILGIIGTIMSCAFTVIYLALMALGVSLEKLGIGNYFS